MSISFSRSLRSLEADSFRPALVGLIAAALVLAAWSAWFFLAQVTLYESSRDLQVGRDGATLLAKFSPEALARIRPGQAASLRLGDAAEKPAQILSAQVMDVPADTRQEGWVEIYVFSPEPLQPGLAGQVRIQVEYVSPAALVLRSAGQLESPATRPAP